MRTSKGQITFVLMCASFLVAVAFVSASYASVNVRAGASAQPIQVTGREIASAQSNPLYSAVLSLRRGPEPCCGSFSLNVANNARSPLEILWNKTFYVHNGIKEGKLISGRSGCGEAALPSKTLIPPGGTFKTRVWPQILAHPHRFPQTCSRSPMKLGRDGIFLTARGDGVVMSQTVTLKVNRIG